MQTDFTHMHANLGYAPPLWWADIEGAATQAARPARRTATADHDFIALLNAFRPTGGLLRGETLAGQMQLRGLGGYSALARWIATGDVLSFAWQEDYWLPAFQFDADLAVRDASRRIVQELTGVFDGWACAHWLVTPHAALSQRTPLECLESEPGNVLRAARADHFAASRG
jgi:hypothetical protein